MYFALNEEENMLQSTAKKYLQSLGGIQLAHDYMSGQDEAVITLWKGIADLGYTGILVPEEYGGIDRGLTAIIPVAEELGRVLAPIPFLESCVFATGLLVKCGTEEQKAAYLPRLVDGSLRFGLCVRMSEPIISSESNGITARKRDEGYVLSGEMSQVRYGKDVNAFIVTAEMENKSGRKEQAVFLLDRDIEGITVEPENSLDKTGQTALVCFDEVLLGSESLLGGQTGLQGLQEALDAMNAALCANLVGGMEKVIETATEYANIRHQFGHPIGRFQAIKHRIADMKVELEMSRSLAYYAALAVQDRVPNVAQIVSASKSYCSEAFVRIASHNIQIHGAIGFSDEHEAHLYLKRAKFMENYGGSPAQHRERIATHIISGENALQIIR